MSFRILKNISDEQNRNTRIELRIIKSFQVKKFNGIILLFYFDYKTGECKGHHLGGGPDHAVCGVNKHRNRACRANELLENQVVR